MAFELTSVTLVVRDYDEAIEYFTQSLGFTLLEDSPLLGGKRWVRVAPSVGGVSLLLARAVTTQQESCVGNQTGGRVAFFLKTDDFCQSYQALQSRGVQFVEAPREEMYGTVAVFLDLYGNRWDLVQPRNHGPSVVAE